jgi:hypothetical protein
MMSPTLTTGPNPTMRPTPGRPSPSSCLGGLALAGLLLGLPAGPARGADPLFAHELPRYRSGDQLLADCRSEEPAVRGRCVGYVMAVADMLGGAAARIDGLQACLNGDESLDDLLSVVERHLEANPARAVLKGDGAVAYALSIYRPCAESEATFGQRLLKR